MLCEHRQELGAGGGDMIRPLSWANAETTMFCYVPGSALRTSQVFIHSMPTTAPQSIMIIPTS